MTRRFATPLDLTNAPDSLRARFWAHVDTSAGPDGCWLWTAYRKPSGYGSFALRKNVFVVASRVSLAMVVPIPAGNVACHRCDNPPCVNPAHLFAGTQSDNANDSVSKGRANRQRGVDKPDAKLTEADVRAIRTADRSANALAREYGVSGTTILRIKNRIKWRHVA